MVGSLSLGYDPTFIPASDSPVARGGSLPTHGTRSDSSKELKRFRDSSNFVERCFLGKDIPLYPPFGLRLKRYVLTSVLVLCCVSSYEGGMPTEMYICQNRSKQRQLAANIRPTSHLSLFVLQSTAHGRPCCALQATDQDCFVHWKGPTCSSKVGFNSNKYSIRENLPGLHTAEETI